MAESFVQRMLKVSGAVPVTDIAGNEALFETLVKGSKTMGQSLPELPPAMAKADPARHTVLATELLFTQATWASRAAFDAGYYFDYCRRLLLHGPLELLGVVRPRLLTVCTAFGNIALAKGFAKGALAPLLRVLDAAAPTPNCLTPIHTLFVKLAIISKQYKVASQLLDIPVLDVQPAKTGLKPVDMLLYFYYGGMVYTALKRFPDALNFFRLCISAPAIAVSAVAAEAYKKYILVSLLVEGKVLPLPRSTPNVVSSALPKLVSQYKTMGNLYQKADFASLKTLVIEKEEMLKTDNNWGLANQVVASLTQRRILRLTHVYITISLEDVARNAGLEDAAAAERQVLRMVEAGMLRARINQAHGMVHFQEEANKYDDPATVAQLRSAIDATVRLGTRLRKLQKDVTLSSAYIKKTASRSGGGAGSGAGAGVPSGLSAMGAAMGGMPAFGAFAGSGGDAELPPM